VLRSLCSVQSATYANAIEKVTANIPDTEIMAKNHLESNEDRSVKRARRTTYSTRQFLHHGYSREHNNYEYLTQNNNYYSRRYSILEGKVVTRLARERYSKSIKKYTVM